MINLGQVGLGYWGPNLLRNFQALPGGKVQKVCDLDRSALDRAQETYSDLMCTMDYDDLLGDPDIEAVVVSSSAPAHYSLAKAALEANKHVFVEKPIALRVDHAEALVALADERGLVLMVGHLLQYHPVFVRLKKMALDDPVSRRIGVLFARLL